MKTILSKILLIIVFLFFGNLMTLHAQKSVLIPESDNKKVLVKIGEENLTVYYVLSQKHSAKLKVKGPGKVSIYIKTAIQDNKRTDSLNNLKYILDGKIIKLKSGRDSSISENSIIIGERCKVFANLKVDITIPPGAHKLEVFSTDDHNKVYSKYCFEKYPDPEWKERLPLKKINTRVLLAGINDQKTIKYYRINSKKRIKFLANHNLHFKLLIRGEFKHHMFSDNEIRILLRENGKTVYTFKVSSTRSKRVEYVDEYKLIPGTLNQIYLQVPKGKHQYELVVADEGKSALVKIYYDTNRYTQELYQNLIAKNNEKKNLHNYSWADIVLH